MQCTASNVEEDDELLKRLASGKEDAFEEIFKQYQSALIFFADRLLASQEITEAEEVVQDVFMAFYERRRNFKTHNSIKAFLYICTKNACLKLLEKNKVKQRRFENYRNIYSDVQESVLDNMIYTEVIRELASAIETLPPQCKVVMKLFFEEAKTAKEIADMLGITISTVNNQKAKAVQILKKRLSFNALIFVGLFF